MGKGGRSHSRKYRIEVHSEEYYKKQRELKQLRERQRAMDAGEIYSGEMKVVVPILPHAITDLFNEINKNRDPKGVKR